MTRRAEPEERDAAAHHRERRRPARHARARRGRRSARSPRTRACAARRVYRHFPDEEALFAACSSHWRAANPAPDPSAWAAIDDPAERLRRALDELYAYYRSTESMRERVLRDEPSMPSSPDC